MQATPSISDESRLVLSTIFKVWSEVIWGAKLSNKWYSIYYAYCICCSVFSFQKPLSSYVSFCMCFPTFMLQGCHYSLFLAVMKHHD